MISKSCNFSEFLDNIANLNYADIILRANDEATKAERAFYKHKARQESESKMYQEYAFALKNFIYFIRSSMMHSPIRNFDFLQCRNARKASQKFQSEG